MGRIRKKRAIFLICLGLAAVIAAVSEIGFSGASARRQYVVVIDAGHGLPDGGATGIVTGVCEADINLAIAQRLKSLFLGADIAVVMTRTGRDCLYSGDGSIKRGDMQMRRDIIERAQPDFVISVHLNKFSQSYRRGAQAFFRADGESGKLLASEIQKSLNRNWNERDLEALSGDYYLLNCSEFPSVIVECGFLSNPEEEALLQTESCQEKIAYCIYAGAIGYLYQVGAQSA